jgi:hypothetical protein
MHSLFDYQKFTNNYPFPYQFPYTSGHTRAMWAVPIEIFQRFKLHEFGTLTGQQSIINGVGGRQIMFEKLLLAVTITFSLNFFLQVRAPEQTSTDASYHQQTDTPLTILVSIPKK